LGRFVNENISIQTAAVEHGVRPRDVVIGLDTLRFVTAMWVAFSHGARFPIDRVIAPDTSFRKVLYLINNTTFNGTAAVSVFFLISGFLIHGANVGKSSVEMFPFWTRRIVRIGIPLAVVIFAARLLGAQYTAALDRILWSVYAEVIYYLLYPLLIPYLFRFGTGQILVGSLCVSLIMLVLQPSNVYLWSFGNAFTWLFCAPLWLMGCYLAEHRELIAKMSRRFSVWVFRAGALAYCYASTILATHLGDHVIGYTWTIWFFGVFCIFWLDAEMATASIEAPSALLERFGLGGYSLYLTHRFALTYVQQSWSQLSPFVFWLLTLAAVLALTWTFYRLVEWPSHLLARKLGRRTGSFATK
jgi:peptidoglycan/LPS O-acetylase OafA/YrhL